MVLSKRWLADYVTIDCGDREFSEAMSISGSKVEGYEKEGAELSNVVVGKILSVEKHPDAEKLNICKVDVGKGEPLQIVTAATNVFAGALVPCALHGSTLHGGINIKKGKLRGEVSEGMFCSVAELGLTVHDFPYAIEDGILIIEEECEIGQDIHSALGLDDTCVEFEITSNRPDCLSVLGLAREVAATFNKPLTLPEVKIEQESGNIEDYLQVRVENNTLCQRYAAKVIKNVKIEPSPRWLRERLRASGVRPINNIVDITNFVMLEYGHPMHAFDLKYVQGGSIVVRNAKEDESIVTLDGIERKLSPEMLVIADAEKPVAVAGVMGGEYSGVMDDTQTIVFEAACFEGVSVRRTSRKLGLRTESSSRFEKGLPAENAMNALLRACQLVEMLQAGEVVGGIIDVNNAEKDPIKIALESDYINAFLGTNISKEEMIRILEKLSFTVENDIVTVPYFRTDVFHKSDLAEEIARIYGYNKIASTAVQGMAQGGLNEKQQMEKKVMELLRGMGMNEIMTYSFISPKYYDKICLPQDSPLRNCVVISNPLGEDTSVMRTTSLPSMLEVIARNYNNRNEKGMFYEIATEYIPQQGQQLPNEKQSVVLGMYGGNWDFFTLKGIVQEMLEQLHITGCEFKANEKNPSYHPGRCAELYIQGTLAGTFGEIHPAVCENYGIGVKVYGGSISFDTLFEKRASTVVYKSLPKYPKVNRDLALLCDQDLPVGEMEKAIVEGAGKILEEVVLFDVYQGEQIPEGKKSVAFSVILRSAEKTLTDEETEAAMKRILKKLTAVGAELRQ